jgi:hypothetical protein
VVYVMVFGKEKPVQPRPAPAAVAGAV